MNPYSIILSTDISDDAKLLEIIKLTKPYIDGVKIHLSSLIFYGYPLLNSLAKLIGDKTLVLDLKIGDIGFINSDGSFEGSNSKILNSVMYMTSEFEEIYITVHGFPGYVSVKECIEVGHDCGLKILLIPMMSHKGSDVFFNFQSPILTDDEIESRKDDEVEQFINPYVPVTASEGILLLGEILGVDGYVGPSNNLDVIHSYRRISGKVIVSPGFGRQSNGQDFSQQFYQWAQVVGSNSAAIIGSMIYNSDNPDRVAKAVMEVRNAYMSDVQPEEMWISDGEIHRSELKYNEITWSVEDIKP